MKKIIRGLLLLMLAAPTASRAMSGGPVEGQVLDYDSGQPVEGAIVVARWQGEVFQIVQSQGVCVHAETVVSNVAGRYRIEGWAGPTLAIGGGLVLDVYKPGYVTADAPLQYQKQIDSQGHSDGTWIIYKRGHPKDVQQVFPDEDSARAATHPNDLYLKPFSGTPTQRIRYIRTVVFNGMNCGEGGASRRNLYPLQKAAYQEARPLANTRDDLEQLRGMRAIAESTWRALRSDEPYPKDRETPEQVKRDFQ